jgi:hypothetical protein
MCHGGGTRRDSAPKLSAAGAFLAYRAICRARQSRQAEGFRRLVRAVEQQGATLSLLSLLSAGQCMQRAQGKWRGSTISGYLRGDEQTYLENFRWLESKV